MRSEATLVLHNEESSLDARIASLTRFSGIECRALFLGDRSSREKFLADHQDPSCVMVSADSLAGILRDETVPRELVTRFFERTPFVLVYGITPGREGESAIRHITLGLMDTVQRFNGSDHAYEVSPASREITGEFTGLTFGPIKNEIDHALVLNRQDPGFTELVTIGKLPFFASFKKQQSLLYLLACGGFADLDTETDGSLPAREYFSRVAPVLMFLRHAFGDRTWHNPTRRANLIIDDPLLRESYGFLNYPQLLKEMDRSGFSSTIAFIPWNYRRTSPAIARLVKERSDRFSVCVHGCDHTSGEFASTDISDLNDRIGLASVRMKAHEQKTGVICDEIMVFPQGRFSSVSLGALKAHNYLAAVNSSVKPQDLGNSHGLTLAEMLEPAISRYSSFPLFMRRYPRDIVDFAFDLFLGKAALLVEHHGYFKDGYEKIREFMTRINALSPDLKWTGLGETLRRTYLQRSTSKDTMECRIFANQQVIDNPAPTKKTFTILKSEGDKSSIREVVIDGQRHPYVLENGYIKARTEIPAFSASKITVSYTGQVQSDSSKHRHTAVQDFKVYLRRHLSEARDNHLSKYPRMLALAYRVKNKQFSAE